MKKILFLMLSLAVAGSAFAGVQKKAQPISQEKQTMTVLAKNTRTNVKLKAANPFVKTQTEGVAYDHRVMNKAKGALRAPVTEQPEGTVKYYQRTAGTAVCRFYNSSASSPWGNVSYFDQDGLVTAVEKGADIWFKNLLFDPDGYFDDYWIKGKKSGTRITIDADQSVFYSSYYDADIILSLGTLSGTTFTPKTDQIRFNISGNTLTLQGTSDDGNGNGDCLGTYWSDDNTWGAFADFGTVLEVTTDVPEAPTMYTDADISAMTGGTEVAYFRTGNAFFYDGGLYMGSQNGAAYIYYDADGSTVYMRDPVYGLMGLGVWVKGTVSGNKITVPLGQYLNWSSDFVGVKTAWGEVTLTPTDSITYIDFAQDESVTECTYTIDGDKITLDGTSEYVGLATVMDSAYVDMEDNWFGNLDYSTEYYVYPATPENLEVTPAATTADVAWTDTENEMWNLRYRIYNPLMDAAYSNDFEETLDGWGVYDADGDGQKWGWFIDPDDENNHMMASLSYNLSPENYLFSADVCPVEGSVVSFNAWGWNGSEAGSQETFDIYCIPVAENDSTIMAIAENVTTNGAEHSLFTYNIPEYFIGDSCYILIVHTGGAGYFCIDNFFVGNPDATPNPWTYVNGVTTNPYTIEGLTPETTYEIEIQGANAGGAGDWSAIVKFTTLADTGLRGDANDDGKVTIADVTTMINHMLAQDWDNVPGVFNYDNADCDLNGTVNISDVTTLINYLLSKNWPAN